MDSTANMWVKVVTLSKSLMIFTHSERSVRTSCLFQKGCISQGKCNMLLMRVRQVLLSLVVRETGLWSNYIYSIQLLLISEHSRKRM